MTLDELFNNAKCNTQDAGYEEGHVSHRKNGDYIKQGGSWVPMKRPEAGADEQTMRQSLINFMTKGLPHVPEADAKKAIEGLPADTLNEMFNNLKEQHGDKYLAKNEDTLKASIIEGMTPEQKQAVMEGKTYRRVKEGEGVVDITKADLEGTAAEKSKDDAYMDEQGLHDIYMDIKNNELEDYTVEEIAKEYRITKGDAEVIKNRIENNKRAKEHDKQDRKDQAAAGSKVDESARIAKSKEDRAKAAKQREGIAQSAVQKYKDLPGEQRKDALYAATHEGLSVATTQTSMERGGWSLSKADDGVNVYEKPDGSKVTMQLEGNKVKSVDYSAPGSSVSGSTKKTEPKLAGDCKVRLSKIKK